MPKRSIIITVALFLAPLSFAQTRVGDQAAVNSDKRIEDSDMRQAIQFQRAKDRADARQARRERAHPSITYGNDRQSVERNTVPDPGERQWKKNGKLQ